MGKYAFEQIGIVGAGSMGSEMAQLFAELGLHVSVFDVAGANIDNLLEHIASPESVAPEARERIKGYKDYDQFVGSLGGKDKRKLFLLSIKHGSPADEVLESLGKYWHEGDVILDGGNEWYLNTERRQKALEKVGVRYIGIGVSGGYQSARRGPSMSPGGDEATIKELMPLLEAFAVNDPKTDIPCVTYIGPGGAGHYVKMVHNGIEQGMLGVLDEVWELMFKCLHMKLGAIADVFERWTAEEQSELHRTFLIEIAIDICRQPDPSGEAAHLLNRVQDKVVQDADDSEGTGTWAVMEASKRHVSAPTFTAAHFFRLASADRAQRLKVADLLGADIGGAKKQQLSDADKAAFLEDMRLATYCAFLASFAQGLNLIARASKDEGWKVRLADCIRIWREGCIIRAEHIADLLQPALEQAPDCTNVLTLEPLAREIRKAFPALKRVVQHGVEWDAHIPTLSASLEYFKYVAGPHLPSQFMEAELDYFGAHSFDDKREPAGEVKKGPHHFEWKKA